MKCDRFNTLYFNNTVEPDFSLIDFEDAEIIYLDNGLPYQMVKLVDLRSGNSIVVLQVSFTIEDTTQVFHAISLASADYSSGKLIYSDNDTTEAWTDGYLTLESYETVQAIYNMAFWNDFMSTTVFNLSEPAEPEPVEP